MNLQELRVEALRATSRIVAQDNGSLGQLIIRMQTIYQWLLTGEDPIIEKTKDA